MSDKDRWEEKHEYIGDDDAVSRGIRWGCWLAVLVFLYFLIRFLVKIDKASWIGLLIFVFFAGQYALRGDAWRSWKNRK